MNAPDMPADPVKASIAIELADAFMKQRAHAMGSPFGGLAAIVMTWEHSVVLAERFNRAVKSLDMARAATRGAR